MMATDKVYLIKKCVIEGNYTCEEINFVYIKYNMYQWRT